MTLVVVVVFWDQGTLFCQIDINEMVADSFYIYTRNHALYIGYFLDAWYGGMDILKTNRLLVFRISGDCSIFVSLFLSLVFFLFPLSQSVYTTHVVELSSFLACLFMEMDFDLIKLKLQRQQTKIVLMPFDEMHIRVYIVVIDGASANSSRFQVFPAFYT